MKIMHSSYYYVFGFLYGVFMLVDCLSFCHNMCFPHIDVSLSVTLQHSEFWMSRWFSCIHVDHVSHVKFREKHLCHTSVEVKHEFLSIQFRHVWNFILIVRMRVKFLQRYIWMTVVYKYFDCYCGKGCVFVSGKHSCFISSFKLTVA